MPRGPEAHYCDLHGVIVHRTHDIAEATRLAKEWKAIHAPAYADTLPKPFATWLRTRPCNPVERSEDDYQYWYEPGTPGVHGTPGVRGTFAAVEFPEDGLTIGTPVELPTQP